MYTDAIKLIDASLNEAIKCNQQYHPDGDISLFGDALNSAQLVELATSLRKPHTLDIEMWAYALAVFQDHILERSGGEKIDIVDILLFLDQFKLASLNGSDENEHLAEKVHDT